MIRTVLRSVLRKPGHFALSAMTLGLGMGAAISIFSAIDAILLEPLPFNDPDRLVEIRTERGGEEALLSMREVLDLREAAGDVLEDLAAYIPGGQYSIAGESGPEKPPAILMTGNLFEVLGVAPMAGGTWPEIYDQERNFGLVLGHDLWERQFGADPSTVGGTVSLDASPFFSPTYEIFGVMPEGFDFPGRTDLYRSIYISDTYPGVEDRERRLVVGVARLAPGVGFDQAQAAITLVGTELSDRFPESNRGVTLTVRPLRESYVAGIRLYLFVLLGAAGALLLTACANVANLTLTQAIARESEYAVRTALGAGRSRVLASLAGEGVVLALAGTIVGAIGAWFATSALNEGALGLPSWMRIELDASVLLASFLIAVVVGVGVGLWPARAGLARDLMATLRREPRGGGGARRAGSRNALVSVEVALSLTLLLGSALLARTFFELGRTDPGLDSDGLLSLEVPLPWSYPMTERVAFQEEVVRRLEEIPGVTRAATNANPPFTPVGQPDRVVLEAEGQDDVARTQNPYMNIQRVSPGYFETVDIPIRDGRGFDVTLDRDSTQLNAIVSERLAARLWPEERAVGKRIRRSSPDALWWNVVGVAGDVRYDGLNAEGGFDVYLSSLQAVDGWAYVLIDTEGDPALFEDAAKNVIWGIDPGQPVLDVRTMEDRIADTVGSQRLVATLFGLFSLVALLLAAGGIFAVVSVLVRQRTGELGLRMALGADGGTILRGVLRDALVPSLVGVGAGLVGGAGVAWAVRDLLHGVSPWDPFTFALVPAILIGVTIVAALSPAVRAARLSPTRALRGD